ncbi:hypothetical protein IKQ26_06845 [bacterium]|nr:hypothetical protein [bacterium]
MRINNISFTGNLYLKKPELWTDGMKKAIAENPTIQKTLQDNDVIGEISAKRENKIPSYMSYHSKGDLIYKVDFVVRKEDASFTDKIMGAIDKTTRKYPVNQHYHSERTTISRISKLKMR